MIFITNCLTQSHFTKKQIKSPSFEKIKRKIGKHPDYTCPQIDKCIEQLEKLRRLNEKLRAKLLEWREECKGLCIEKDKWEKKKKK